ncbi:MAG: AsmA family protein [Alphaproteobacteria bacterium]|nr:AsmA family protein [Alphaproteobacteria bacterium]
MKALKWIVIGLVGLIVLAVGGVAVFLSTLDVNKYKPQIVEAAKNATGRELKLTGDIKLGLGFNPSFSVADVSFANASWGSRPEMVKVGRFEVQVALIPLLSQQVDVKKLVLLDADLLAKVYLELIGGRQSGMEFGAQKTAIEAAVAVKRVARPARPHAPSEAELAAHAAALAKLKAPVWMN